jgi:two-component system, cell cycle response regulator
MENRPSKSAESDGFFRQVHRLLTAWRQAVHMADPDTARTAIDSDIEHRLRGNERIWAGFREIEIRMLAAETLHAVMEVLSRDLPNFFPGVDAVSIAWRDPDYELTRLLEQEDGAAASGVFVALRPPFSGPISPNGPLLGALDTASQQRLFPHTVHSLQSAAIVPLVLRGERVGSLNQGSTDPRHFAPDAATDFIEHLAAVAAICIDNAVNRARLRRDGLTDMLTQVANRRFFDRRLREEISQWLRRGGDLSCLLVDLDCFKLINDRHGHQAGDLVLQEVARTLSKGLRESDVLARYGGEEFVLLLPATGSERAAEIAERLRAAVAGLAISPARGASLQVTASFGLASLADSLRATLEDPGLWLLRQADQALYTAKARGRNRVATAHDSDTEATTPPTVGPRASRQR